MPPVKKPRKPTVRGEARSNGSAIEVLTLAEAAAYLRLTESEVLKLASTQELPGRCIGAEWRFLKSAIREWLSKPPRVSNKEAWMALAGAWKDDPSFEDMIEELQKRRGKT